jgi:hypothetical protein
MIFGNSEQKITPSNERTDERTNERTDDRPICESGFLQKRAKNEVKK